MTSSKIPEEEEKIKKGITQGIYRVLRTWSHRSWMHMGWHRLVEKGAGAKPSRANTEYLRWQSAHQPIGLLPLGALARILT